MLECSTFETEVPKHIRFVDLEKQLRRLECADLLLTHLGAEVRGRSGEIALPLADDGVRVSIGQR